MKGKLVNKKNYMNLIETLSTIFYQLSTVGSLIDIKEYTTFKVISSERE